MGWGDEFSYIQCANCRCLQISIVPDDLARFYPAHYQSFNVQIIPQHGWRACLGARRDYTMSTGKGNIGKFLNRLIPAKADLLSMASVPAEKTMKILDVGCGRGALLSTLRRAGFSRLMGIDPYVSQDIEILPGLFVRKLSLEQVQEQFDLIMFHHVFEHIESNLETLQLCHQRLLPHGRILLRFPVADSYAWEEYSENWVQLDAPRHLFLHTKTSLELLANQTGLKIEKWFCDSDAFQFWGSELYLKGIPLFDQKGIATDLEKHFSKAEMKSFAERAKFLNANGRGDQVVAILSVQND